MIKWNRRNKQREFDRLPPEKVDILVFLTNQGNEGWVVGRKNEHLFEFKSMIPSIEWSMVEAWLDPTDLDFIDVLGRFTRRQLAIYFQTSDDHGLSLAEEIERFIQEFSESEEE